MKQNSPQEILQSKFINFSDSFEFIVRVKIIEAMEQYANQKLKEKGKEIFELKEVLRLSEANYVGKNAKLEKEVESLNKFNNDLFAANVTANKKVDLLVTQLEKLLKAIENETR